MFVKWFADVTTDTDFAVKMWLVGPKGMKIRYFLYLYGWLNTEYKHTTILQHFKYNPIKFMDVQKSY